MKAAKLFFIILCLAALIAPAAAAGGAGTAANPYIIQTPAELQSIQNNLGAYYRLANDIDLSGVTWTPIGTGSAGFYGELDGNGKTIKNLELSTTTQSSGLFSGLTSGATIKDLTLEDCQVESTSSWCGCLVGSIIMSSSAHETATLQNIDMVRCSATSSNQCVSVLCGVIFTAAVVDIADCTLINCVAESTGSSSVSLLCGRCSGGGSVFAANCVAENSITKAATNYAGGLFGRVDGTGSSIGATGCTVKECTVVATGNYAGGIAGRVVSEKTGVFDSCTVTGCTILALSYAAGICPAYS